VAETNAKNAPRSPHKVELASKSGSTENEPRQGETRTSLSATGTAAVNSGNAPEVISKGGLTSDDARRQLAKFGPNAMPDTSAHPLRIALEKFWAPVPWMLEAAIVLELVLGKYVEAAIIALLLVFNAGLGLFQESRAQATLAALKSRLALSASVKRDGVWKTVPATDLAPGDLVKLSLGGVVAADVKLSAGEVLVDQSMLTGESVPIEAGAGLQTFAGALVRRGEAEAEVTATGARTKFGRTAELVRTAHVVGSQQKAVLRVVRNLAAFNGVVITLLVAYACYLKMPVADIIPLVLTAILASIPVALPATCVSAPMKRSNRRLDAASSSPRSRSATRAAKAIGSRRIRTFACARRSPWSSASSPTCRVRGKSIFGSGRRESRCQPSTMDRKADVCSGKRRSTTRSFTSSPTPFTPAPTRTAGRPAKRQSRTAESALGAAYRSNGLNGTF
jgi:hypothetical protein